MLHFLCTNFIGNIRFCLLFVCLLIQKESWSSVVQLGTELLLIDLEDGCVLHKINLMFLERSAYTKALLSRFGMDKANSVATPVDVNADLVTTSDEVEDCDKDLYQSAVGSLLY
ncbi:hypothetical protein FHG87_014712 [Trinorchestia longiramus]|nr:hypothetical protein FHG87_014712 [Trinorchestia longiramus]